MRFGVCAAAEQLPRIVEAGADYIECPLVGINSLTDEALGDFQQMLAAQNFRCESMAILFPGADIPLTGEKSCLADMEAYVQRVFKRVAALNPSVVVFGSGGARRYPEGFDPDKALAQLAEAGRRIAQAAAPYGITVALEPLNRSECNIINSLSEAVSLVQQVAMPNFKITADIYHMLMEEEPPEALLACRGLLAHTHVATKVGRACPQGDDRAMFLPYFAALKEIGYDGRMSIEGNITQQERLREALMLLRQWSEE